MPFDLDTLLEPRHRWAASDEDVIEEAAWLWLERAGWVATPELFFAMKTLIREQMAGG